MRQVDATWGVAVLQALEYVTPVSFEHCFILFSSFPLLLAFVVGGLGFEFCLFVAGWRHALRSEWPFIIIYLHLGCSCPTGLGVCHRDRGRLLGRCVAG